jgi:hypothetical protein
MTSCDSEPQVPQAELGTFKFAIKQIPLGENVRIKANSLHINQLVITISKADGTVTDYTQKSLMCIYREIFL